MNLNIDQLEVVVEHLPDFEYFLIFYWICLTVVYVLSFLPFISPFNSYGKLQVLKYRVQKCGCKSRFFHISLYLCGIIVNSLLCAFCLGMMLTDRIDVDQFKDMEMKELFMKVFFSIVENHDIIPVVLFMMEFQLLRRFLESVFVTNFSDSMISWYLEIFGFVFYIGLSISIAFSETKRYLNKEGKRNNLYLIGGVLLFFFSSYFQTSSHRILATLRKGIKGKRIYLVPYGEWFKVLAAPHYTFEILIYLSFLFVNEFKDLLLSSILLFVFVNRIICSYQTRKWYIQKLDDYPKNRKILIPYVL